MASSVLLIQEFGCYAGANLQASPYAEQSDIFLPTKAYILLESLVKEFPLQSLILADFDELPETVIPGMNAPLVATTVSLSCVERTSCLGND